MRGYAPEYCARQSPCEISPDRVQDILEAIDRVERHTNGGRAAFDNDELIQVWMVRHLQIIGEAAIRLSQDARDQQPDVPCREIIGMRHILVHGYFEVDNDLVWSVVEHELGALRRAVAQMAVQFDTPQDTAGRPEPGE